MKTKIFLSMLTLFAWTATLSAQITREKADEIVINYVKNEVAPTEGVSLNAFLLYVNANTPNENGFSMTTVNGETIKAKYACWVYYVRLAVRDCDRCISPQQRYLFVKEDNGSVLEIITNEDDPQDVSLWTHVNIPVGIIETKANSQFLYPNPVDDWLTIPCNGENVRVEIYDLKGVRLFAETLSGADTCQLNVSFLSAGTYLVNVGGKTYRLIKS